MDFSQVEAEFGRLKAQFDRGTLTDEDFRARLQQLMVQDDQGRWWMIGAETGHWYLHNGEQWVSRDPPQRARQSPAEAPLTPQPSPGKATGSAARSLFGLRLVAFLVDWLVLLLLSCLITALADASDISSSVLQFLTDATYFVAFWSATGQTLGKLLVGVKVVTGEGSTPTAWQALARYIGYILSMLPLGLGFLWTLWDDDQRGWHDHIAGTRVVPARRQV